MAGPVKSTLDFKNALQGSTRSCGKESIYWLFYWLFIGRLSDDSENKQHNCGTRHERYFDRRMANNANEWMTT